MGALEMEALVRRAIRGELAAALKPTDGTAATAAEVEPQA